MELFLVRHGQSTANRDKIVQGQLNTELTELGKTQAKLTAERLKKYQFDKIYSSDLQRAYKTAQEINKHQNLEIIQDKKIREINSGDWHGIPIDQIDFTELEKNKYGFRRPNGESTIDQNKRVNNFLAEIKKKYENTNKKILIVAHGHVNKLILKNLFNYTFENYHELNHPTNCSFYHIKLKPNQKPQYIIENCNKHLKKTKNQ